MGEGLARAGLGVSVILFLIAATAHAKSEDVCAKLPIMPLPAGVDGARLMKQVDEGFKHYTYAPGNGYANEWNQGGNPWFLDIGYKSSGKIIGTASCIAEKGTGPDACLQLSRKRLLPIYLGGVKRKEWVLDKEYYMVVDTTTRAFSAKDMRRDGRDGFCIPVTADHIHLKADRSQTAPKQVESAYWAEWSDGRDPAAKFVKGQAPAPKPAPAPAAVPNLEVVRKESPELPLASGAPMPFKSAARGAKDVTRTIRLTNRGNAPLDLVAVQLTGRFSFKDRAPSGSIPVGQTASLTVLLDTSTAGTFAGELVIHTNDPDTASFRMPITGTVLK